MKPIKGLLTQTIAAAGIFAAVAAAAPDVANAQFGMYGGGRGPYSWNPPKSLRHLYNRQMYPGSPYKSGCNVPYYLPNGNTGGTYNVCRGQRPRRGWGSGPMYYRW
ncbi:MAG TPA: hypothetical protein VFS88_06880 [Micavibrio sp.]|nr:hypothetical protein [Micavibrio sp.]